MTAAAFRYDTLVEPAARFHGRDLLSEPTPRVLECRSTTTALVLGSAQRSVVVDDGAVARYGVEVTRRRSGGGAVLVEPDGIVWFDVVVPADDRRFAGSHADVTASMRWLGSRVLSALAVLGATDAQMHAGPMECREWCRLVCFAGLAPGEITIGGRKLVGISQRRTRSGSRFQCAVHTRWAPDHLLGLLAAPKPDARELPPVATLDPAVAGAVPGALVRVLNAL